MPGIPDVDYAGTVRARDPESSWEAADQQTRSKSQMVRDRIVELLAEHGPMTDEQIYDRYKAMMALATGWPMATPQSVRTRRKELELAGKVRWTGLRGRSQYGNPSNEWEAVR